MNSISRYFLPSKHWQTSKLELTGDEAHHCSRVLRSKQGDIVEVFDGEGTSAKGEITSLNKELIEINLNSEPVKSSNPHKIHLIQAIPKGGNMELIVQKATELGVSSILPLISEHTVARTEQLEKKTLKWQRIALEACKQCGQNHLPTIHPPITFQQWSNETIQTKLNIVAALLPESQPISDLFHNIDKPTSTSILIGPEGDFSDQEYQQIIDLGYKPVSLGNIVLRVETATLFCISVIKHELNKTQPPSELHTP